MSPYGKFLLEHCSWFLTGNKRLLRFPWYLIKDNPFDNDFDRPKIAAYATRLRIKIIWYYH